MRILLDECVPRGLRAYLVGHAVSSVQTLGWSHLNDRTVLSLASGRFDVLVTTDRSMRFEQNLEGLRVAVVVLRGRTTTLKALQNVAPRVREAIEKVVPETWVEVEAHEAP